MSQVTVPEHLEDLEKQNRIKVNQLFEGIVELSKTPLGSRSRTPGKSKDYFEFLELVSEALTDFQRREKAPFSRQISTSWERPNFNEETERITISLLKREPGAFDGGPPMKAGSVKNWRPLLREKCEDPDHPTYLMAIQGKWYDNLIGFTVWAQTNKEAIERAFWFENFMEKYEWWFRVSGVSRVIFWSQEEDKVEDNDGQKLYGRQLVYFVKTEKITTVSEKTIEDINLTLSVGRTNTDT